MKQAILHQANKQIIKIIYQSELNISKEVLLN
jgi:hypothetical protein